MSDPVRETGERLAEAAVKLLDDTPDIAFEDDVNGPGDWHCPLCMVSVRGKRWVNQSPPVPDNFPHSDDCPRVTYPTLLKAWEDATAKPATPETHPGCRCEVGQCRLHPSLSSCGLRMPKLVKDHDRPLKSRQPIEVLKPLPEDATASKPGERVPCHGLIEIDDLGYACRLEIGHTGSHTSGMFSWGGDAAPPASKPVDRPANTPTPAHEPER